MDLLIGKYLQLGHQAAQCTNGTINWRQLYGDESFRLKQPLYESELLKLHKERAIDLAALEARARDYARVCPPGLVLWRVSSRLLSDACSE